MIIYLFLIKIIRQYVPLLELNNCANQTHLICNEIPRNCCKSKHRFDGRVLMPLTDFHHSVEFKNKCKQIVQEEYTYTVLTCICRHPGTKRATKAFVIT